MYVVAMFLVYTVSDHCQTSLTVLHQGDRSSAAGRHKQHRTALPPDQGKLLELERLLERLGISQGGPRGLPVRHQAGQADEVLAKMVEKAAKISMFT